MATPARAARVASGKIRFMGGAPPVPSAFTTHRSKRSAACRLRRGVLCGATTAIACLAAAGAASATDVRNVLPPGANGLSNLAELGAFLTTGARPAHNDDQLGLYSNLLKAPKPFTDATLKSLFKDASFGGGPSVTRPRSDVRIERDSAYGIPHVYGDTREAAMFGIGYATAHDRLFFMDIFRHLGRAQLSSFAGGDPANRAFDALMWTVAPYTEADLEHQVDQRPRGYVAQADQLRSLL